MTGDDVKMLSARVPVELKRMVDADPRDNQEVVEAALWGEFGGERKAAIERRIENKRNELEAAKRTLASEEENVGEIQAEIEELVQAKESVQEKVDEREQELQEAIEAAKDAPRDPENPAIQAQAKNVGMEPEAFVDELPERDDDGPRSL